MYEIKNVCFCFKEANRNDLITYSGLLAIGTVMIVLFGVAVNDSETKKDSQRYPVAQAMLAISILGTFLSIL